MDTTPRGLREALASGPISPHCVARKVWGCGGSVWGVFFMKVKSFAAEHVSDIAFHRIGACLRSLGRRRSPIAKPRVMFPGNLELPDLSSSLDIHNRLPFLS